MALVEEIQRQLAAAMKERMAERLATLRMVKSALKNEEIAVGHPLDDEAALKVMQRLGKQRKESIEAFEAGGRQELADRERAELAIIESFLPQAPSDEEVRN